MDFLPQEIRKYAEDHTLKESSLLRNISRETHLKTQLPQMLAGNFQGQLLRMFSLMIKPAKILEIGTFTGYSAICLAQGLQKGGVLHTIESNKELEEMVLEFFSKVKTHGDIKLHIGEGKKLIGKIKGPFDLVYIDADKPNYSNYFELVMPKVRNGGYIIADNVLWSGRVIEKKQDKDTRAINQFNKKMVKDNRVEQILLPIRDGLMIVRKK